jgi:hypothetical protein
MYDNCEPRARVLFPRRIADRVSEHEGGGCEEVPSPQRFSDCLIGRLDALQGVQQKIALLPDGTLATDHFIEHYFVRRFPCVSQQLLCHIDINGILLPHLSAADAKEVVDKGWGFCEDSANIVLLPRDWIEVEIVWRVVLLAYRYLTSSSAVSRAR